MENRHSRRAFVEKVGDGLKLTAFAYAAQALLGVQTSSAEPRDYMPFAHELRFDELGEYMSFVDSKKDEVQQFVEQNDVMSSIKNLSQEQKMQDFNMYFPMYLAAQIKYEVPWYMLWIIHEHETAASRSTDSNLFIGGMQRGRQVDKLVGSKEHAYETVIDARKGWEFLAELPQRQKKPRNESNDSDEILWAARNIRQRADNPAFFNIPGDSADMNFDAPLESRIKAIIKWKYSAPQHGRARVQRYEELTSRGGLRVETP